MHSKLGKSILPLLVLAAIAAVTMASICTIPSITIPPIAVG
jgi:hypothetical protein